MIWPMHENEAFEMSNFGNITDASRRFAATYNDSSILKLRIWWWNLTRRQRRFYVISLLIFAVLLTFIFVTVSVQHKPVALIQTSTSAFTTAVTVRSSSVTGPTTSISTIATNTSIGTSTTNATATTPTVPMTSINPTNSSMTPTQGPILKKKIHR
ncbi:unnamed protein product [Litomosoides sigmodontis]|uniref:Uncharacterized protein n=1 Tax=Litomosoides sigmodontis TaxID=42156 RepID=A0A3P6V1W7_LITSI|nr:unnamed protein product [Litomosoides sigmodontis]